MFGHEHGVEAGRLGSHRHVTDGRRRDEFPRFVDPVRRQPDGDLHSARATDMRATTRDEDGASMGKRYPHDSRRAFVHKRMRQQQWTGATPATLEVKGRSVAARVPARDVSLTSNVAGNSRASRDHHVRVVHRNLNATHRACAQITRCANAFLRARLARTQKGPGISGYPVLERSKAIS